MKFLFYEMQLTRLLARLTLAGVGVDYRASVYRVVVAATICFALLNQSGFAQQPKRVGVLVSTILPQEMQALKEGMREAGYTEGGDVVFDVRNAKGDYSRMPGLTKDLLRANPHVIVSDSTPGTGAAMQATSTIPIVMTLVGDPVAAGLVKSLRHPGRNVTGLSAMAPEVSLKRLQFLKDIIPTLKAVGVLCDPSVSWHSKAVSELQQAGAGAGIVVKSALLRRVADFESAFSAMRDAHVEALSVLDSGLFVEERQTLIRLAARSKLPLIYFDRQFVRDGGLISYAADTPDLYRRSAGYVDRLLKGANAADLPVQQPTKFELVVNVKTAKALQLTIPNSVLERADEVIK